MRRERAMAILRAHEPDLRSLGVVHAALFGSVARDDATATSDTDILIEFDPDAHPGLWADAGVKEYIAALFDGPVDVVDREALKPFIAPAATADAIYAF
jgi:predicted nucleotidyltransferase